MFALQLTAQTSAHSSIDLAENAERQLRAGHKQEALALLQQAAAAKSQTAKSEDKIGFLFAVFGAGAEAHEHFKKALALDANFAPAHYHLGAADWLAGEKQEGLRELELATNLTPANFEYRYRLGTTYLDGGDVDKAYQQLKQAVQSPNVTEPAWRSFGQALEAKGQLTEAIAAYERALQLKPDDNAARNELSNLLVLTRQPERGIQEANRILADDPQNFSAHMNLGYAYLKTGEYAKAEAAYRAAASNDSTSAPAHYDLAIALKMQDRLETARQEFEKAVNLDPTMAEAQYSIGIIAWQSGDFPAMTAALKAAIAIRPTYAEAHYMLGIALKASDNPDQAIEELRQSIRLDPSTPGPYNTLGQLLRQRGDKQGSAEAFATGAKLKKEKDAQLTNNLDQGMRGGEVPSPINRRPKE
jgi:tetratricopeptide (TPR) repeat protein